MTKMAIGSLEVISNPASDSGYLVDYPEERAEGIQMTVFVGEERVSRP